MAQKVLIVATSADQFAGKPSGCWVEEVAAPFFVFKEKGYDVTIASIKGGEIPFDEASLGPPYLTKDAEKFILDDEAMKLVTESIKLSDITNLTDYDAIFLPGGHGTVVDFPTDPDLAKAVQVFWDAGKVVSAVCHGPNGLVSAVSSSGEPIVKGKKVTGFSNTEEAAVGKDTDVPFLLEDKLKELGGVYEKADNWAPHAVRDGKLVTGQNPASSHAVAVLVVEALSE